MNLSITQIHQNERNQAENRKKIIHTLIKKYSKHRGWKSYFLDKNPMFNNNEGGSMITNAHTGKLSDRHFFEAIVTFDKLVEEEKPEWYKITH